MYTGILACEFMQTLLTLAENYFANNYGAAHHNYCKQSPDVDTLTDNFEQVTHFSPPVWQNLLF
jgi:hypothetical protein